MTYIEEFEQLFLGRVLGPTADFPGQSVPLASLVAHKKKVAAEMQATFNRAQGMSFEVLGEKLFSSAQFSTGVRRSPNADSDSLPYILYFGNTIQYVPFQKVYAMQFRCDVGPDASKTVKTLARSALELVCAEAEKCFPGMSESKNLKHSDDRGIYSVAFMFSPEKISIPMQRLSALGTVLAEAVMKSKNGVIQ